MNEALIRQLQEADIFKPVSREEGDARRELKRAEAQAQRDKAVATILEILEKAGVELDGPAESAISFENGWVHIKAYPVENPNTGDAVLFCKSLEGAKRASAAILEDALSGTAASYSLTLPEKLIAAKPIKMRLSLINVAGFDSNLLRGRSGFARTVMAPNESKTGEGK